MKKYDSYTVSFKQFSARSEPVSRNLGFYKKLFYLNLGFRWRRIDDFWNENERQDVVLCMGSVSVWIVLRKICGGEE